MLRARYHELDVAEVEAKKQRRKDNALMATRAGLAVSQDSREMYRKAKARAARAAGVDEVEQDIPEHFTDDQMDMANKQAFQETATRASMTVAKAVRRISKRSGKNINHKL
eukprot:2737843-Heterocapsa_arctica.AAC.1